MGIFSPGKMRFFSPGKKKKVHEVEEPVSESPLGDVSTHAAYAAYKASSRDRINTKSRLRFHASPRHRSHRLPRVRREEPRVLATRAPPPQTTIASRWISSCTRDRIRAKNAARTTSQSRKLFRSPKQSPRRRGRTNRRTAARRRGWRRSLVRYCTARSRMKREDGSSRRLRYSFETRAVPETRNSPCEPRVRKRCRSSPAAASCRRARAWNYESRRPPRGTSRTTRKTYPRPR